MREKTSSPARPVLGINHRLSQQLNFLREIDAMKDIWRKTYLISGERVENDAEHSWEMTMMSAVLVEYLPNDADLHRIIMMLLIHDLVEIHAGDTFAYNDAALADQEEREQQAAERIFGLLPTDQANEFRLLWDEFEARKTPDARFAKAMDRLQPLLHSYYTQGKTWSESGVRADQVRKLKSVIRDASTELGDLADHLIVDAIEQGFLPE